MTGLHRPVKRVTRGLYNGRRLVVSLLPGDVIHVREMGRHEGFACTADWLYLQLAKRAADREVARRVVEKRLGKKGRAA